MDAALFLKLLSDLFVFATAASLFLPAGECLLPLFLCGCFGILPLYVFMRTEKTGYRLLSCAPVLIILFFITTVQSAFILVPAMAYTAFTCSTGRLLQDREDFSAYFKPFLVFGALVVLTLIILSREGETLKNFLPCYITGAILGILTMRAMRHSEQTRRSTGFFALNFALPAAIVLIAFILAYIGAAGMLKSIIALVYDKVICPIFMGLAYGVFSVGYLITQFIEWLISGRTSEGEKQEFNVNLESMEEQLGMESGEGSALAAKVLTAIAILIGLVIIFLIFKRMLGGKASRSTGPVRDTYISSVPKEERKRFAGIRLGTSYSDQIRKCFRKTMSLAGRHGIEFLPSDTSETIVRKCAGVLDMSLFMSLRELYIRARYDPMGTDRQEANKAKTLYDRIKKGIEEKSADA